MSEKSVRVLRVERELHHLVSTYVSQAIPEAMPSMVTVSAVDVAGDLRKAAVYIRLVGDPGEIKETEVILDNHKKRVQSRVAKELQLKFCPVLEFRFGHARQEDHVDRLLADLNRRHRPWE